MPDLRGCRITVRDSGHTGTVAADQGDGWLRVDWDDGTPQTWCKASLVTVTASPAQDQEGEARA